MTDRRANWRTHFSPLLILIVLALLAVILTGCGSGDSNPPTGTPTDSSTTTTSNDPAGDPAQVVEQYLQTKITGDDAQIRLLLCAAKEADFETEASSFDGVKASIEGMKCTREGDTNRVTCEGKIVAVYGGENTEFPLGTYLVALDDGVWKWCGAAE